MTEDDLSIEEVDRVRDWAVSGVPHLTGDSDGSPSIPPGAAATWAGRFLETVSRSASDRDAFPRAIDGRRILAERAALLGLSRQGSSSPSGASRLLKTVDGWVAVTLSRPSDFDLIEALIEDQSEGDPWSLLERWCAAVPNAVLAERAELLGLAAYPVNESRSAGSFTPGDREPGQVRGLRVVDLSALWAGPLCSSLLAAAGAAVIRIESRQRPDGARRGNPDFYDLLHQGIPEHILDFTSVLDRDILRREIDAADIVIESSRPRALAGLGINADEVVERGAVWLSITADGRASPRVGFGDDVAASAGLVSWHSGRPRFCGDAIADPLTGLAAAAEVVRSVGVGGRLIDMSMSGVVRLTLQNNSYEGTPAAVRRDGRWGVDIEGIFVPIERPFARGVR